MPSFVLLSRLKPLVSTRAQLDQVFSQHVRAALPEVTWATTASIREFEYIDRFDAPNEDQAVLVSMLARVHAGAQSELWTAPEWERFQQLA